MEWSQIASGGVFAATAVGALLAYFKYKPGQREHVDMTIAQANMNVAQGTFQLVTTELEDQFKRMAAEMAEVRNEHRQYRADTDARLSELAAELRAEKAEKEGVKHENVRLSARVKSLEDEVFRLKTRPIGGAPGAAGATGAAGAEGVHGERGPRGPRGPTGHTDTP